MKLLVPNNVVIAALSANQERFIKEIESNLDSNIHIRGNDVNAEGADAEQALKVIEELVQIIENGQSLDENIVRRSVQMVKDSHSPSQIFTDKVFTTSRGKVVAPKTKNQKRYIDSIRKNTITFGIGPAGTGKSWLAVASAVRALQDKEVERILLTRPAVEAGENLGYLPGDLMSKVDPYLRPLYDALSDMVGVENMAKYFEHNIVEVAPLAYMRGRTLNDSFVILDEAQNTTPQQMMMFLTRIGFNTKVVITGDKTQTDIRGGKSGLSGLDKILGDINDLDFVFLNSGDVVRHQIVQDIVDAYETNGKA